jgi:dihydroorotase
VSFVDTRNNRREGKVHLRPSGTVAAGVAYGRPYQVPFSPR